MIDCKEVIENKLKLSSNEDVTNYVGQLKKRFIEQKDIDLLDPDLVDSSLFWKMAESIDKTAICSVGNNKQEKSRLNTILAMNACLFECINYLPNNSRVVEIGAGYGNLYSFFNEKFDYYPFDVNPLFDDCIKVDGSGNFPDGLLENESVDCIFSSNVFQHLSVKQIDTYLDNSFNLLNKNGRLVITFACENSFSQNINHYPLQDRVGNKYISTLGQTIKIMTDKEFISLAYNRGFSRYKQVDQPLMSTFFMSKIEKSDL